MTKAEKKHAMRLRKENMPKELEEYIHHIRHGLAPPPMGLVPKNMGEILRNLKEEREDIPLWVSMKTPPSLLKGKAGREQGRIEFGRSGGYQPTGKFVDGTRKMLYKLAASGKHGGYLCGQSADKLNRVQLYETYDQMVGHESSVRVYSTQEQALKEERMLRVNNLPQPYIMLEIACWGGFTERSKDGSFIFSNFSPMYARGAEVRLAENSKSNAAVKWQKAMRATKRVPLLASAIKRSYAQEMEFKIEQKRLNAAKKDQDDLLAYTKRRWNRFQTDKDNCK
jgi:hypothetical protein